MFDREDESRRVIERGTVDGADPMTRTHRWQPIAMDVRRDRAAVVFVRRTRRRAWLEYSELTFADGTWTTSEPFAWRCQDIELPWQPTEDRALATVSPVTGMTASGSMAVINTARGVVAVRYRGVTRPVNGHGIVVFTRMPRKVEFLDANGRRLGTWSRREDRWPRPRPRRLPPTSSLNDDWFNYAPR